MYYRTNVNCYWQGPIKVLTKEGNHLHCLKHRYAVVINIDDVLLHKPEADFSAEGATQIEERLLNKKENEALTERNLCSISDVAIEDNNLPDAT